MNFILWTAGYLFTEGFIYEPDRKWWTGIVLLVFWPFVLGAYVRKVLES